MKNPFKLTRFPITAVIILKRNDNYSISYDKMRRVVDKESGHEYYTFKKNQGEYRPLPFNKIWNSEKGLVCFLFSPASGQYFLVDIKEDFVEKDVVITKFENNKLVEETVKRFVPIVKPINESIRQTASVIHHRIDMRYPKGKSLFEKYALIIYLIVWALAIALPMLFYPTYLDAVSKNAGSVASQISNLVNQLTTASQSVASSGVVRPPI